MASACSSQGSAPGSAEYWRNRPASVASASAARCSGGIGGGGPAGGRGLGGQPPCAAPGRAGGFGELGLGGGVAHGLQRVLDHEHAEVAGRGELLLGPAAHGGKQLL